MDQKYQDWIHKHYPDGGASMCNGATADMVKEFPELTRVRGYYGCPRWGRSAHWWCKTATGEIVDPTAGQFVPGGEYEEFDESKAHLLPTGKCMDCGEYVYNNNTFCNDDCERATRRYLGLSL